MVPGYTGSDTGMNRVPHPRTRAPRSNASPLSPAHLGFVPQAQFIFAKNCSQVWAEALNGFTQWSGGQGSQELPKEAKGEKDVEKDQEPKPGAELEAEKEPELGQEAEQVRWRRLRQDPAVGAGSPCLCAAGPAAAMCRLAVGAGPGHQPHCPGSLCYNPGAEFVCRFSSINLLTRLRLIPWMTETLASSSCQVRGCGQ